MVFPSSETCLKMLVATPSAADFPKGLVAVLVEGKVLRPLHIAAARRRLAAGEWPTDIELAEAVVREARSTLALT